MPANNKILSWNLNSLNKKYPYLQILLSKYNPLAICLQETKLDPNKDFKIKNYNLYRYEPLTTGNLKGGVLIAVHSTVRST